MNRTSADPLGRLPNSKYLSRQSPAIHRLIKPARRARLAERGTKSLTILLAFVLTINNAKAVPALQVVTARSGAALPVITAEPPTFQLSDTPSQGFVVSQGELGTLRAPRATVTLPLGVLPVFTPSSNSYAMGCTALYSTTDKGFQMSCPLVTKVGIYKDCEAGATKYFSHICVVNDYENSVFSSPATVAFPIEFLVAGGCMYCDPIPSPDVLKKNVTVTVTDSDKISTVSLQTTLGKVAVVMNAVGLGWVKSPYGHHSCDEGSSSGLPDFGILLASGCGSRAELIAEQVLVSVFALILVAVAPEVIGGDALDILSWVPAGSETDPSYVYPAFLD